MVPCELSAMGSPQQHRENTNRRIEMGECGRGEQRAGRDADECMDHVPHGIDRWNFVGNELNDIERNRRPNHPSVAAETRSPGV